jgi:signal transduction histidine kinase
MPESIKIKARRQEFAIKNNAPMRQPDSGQASKEVGPMHTKFEGSFHTDRVQRILAVDDEPYILNAIRRLFRDQPVRLETAESGEEALSVMAAYVPDLVILDITMPGIDGYEVCRRIKSDTDLNRTMVLMLSAHNRLDDRLNGYRIAADDYLTKPYEPEELKAKVDVLLRLKCARDKLEWLNSQLEAEVHRQANALMRKEKQAIIGQMIQGIVHNLRGPLMVIDGNRSIAELLVQSLMQEESREPQSIQTRQHLKKCLDKISEGTQRTATLINNLLAAGGRDDGDGKVDVNLNDVIRREADFLTHDLAEKHGIRVHTDLANHLPMVKGHDTDFSQIVYNLIKNAADAMAYSETRDLTITTQHDPGGTITLRFSDTGCGIAAEALDKIFDPFFSTKSRRQEGTTDHSTGTGIGLYFCSQLVKSYGGDISVESQSGQGTIFTITLPTEDRSV